MEAAGSAVGVASLGIQVCQGLLSYYDSWRDYSSDIDSVYVSIADLSKTLVLLVSSLKDNNLDEERVERVRSCLASCEGALHELQEQSKSLRKYEQPQGHRQKTWAEIQRLWFPFRKQNLANLQASVIDIQERLKLALQVLQLDIGSETREIMAELVNQTTGVSATATHLAAQTQSILDKQQVGMTQKIAKWLSPADPWTNHDSARQRHETQTCDWLLQHSQYRKWKAGEFRHLWMHGKAGCGKTVLCSTVVEDVQRHCQTHSNTACLLFYFTFSDEHKQSSTDLLRSMIQQLGQKEPGMSVLRDAYDDHDRSNLGPAELRTLLLSCIGSQAVFLVMDALDECSEEHEVRPGVLELIEYLNQETPNLQIFATSRELDDISDVMETLESESISIATSATDSDIQIYVSSQLARHRSFRNLDTRTRDLIQTTIVAKSDGMFRWAYCQLQALKKLKSIKPKYLKQALNSLPATLDDTYTRMILGIEDLYVEEALALLNWLAYARKPPTPGELAEAAIIDPSVEDSIDEENRGDLRDTLRILGGLVTTEGDEPANEISDCGTHSYPSDRSSSLGQSILLGSEMKSSSGGTVSVRVMRAFA